MAARKVLQSLASMSVLSQLLRHEPADSSLAFRDRAYRRGEHGTLLRDVLALANAAVPGRRFLFLGVDDHPGRERRFPGISERTWKRTCEVLPGFLDSAVEPRVIVTLEAIRIDDVLIGAICLDACMDPPYLLARRASPSMPAGGGWIRKGVRTLRMTRRHLQRIFEQRYRPPDTADVQVGFPGKLPREEIELPVMALDELPSALAEARVNRMIEARKVAKSVLGHSDTRIARLVHAQVSNGDVSPYRSQDTQQLCQLLRRVPGEQASADDYYLYEERAHRINVVLRNLTDKPLQGLVLTLKIPRVEGLGVSDRVYLRPGDVKRTPSYPTVDVGPRTIAIQVSGLKVAAGATVEAFFEPLRLWLREAAAGRTIRLIYVLQGKALKSPVQGWLKIIATDG